MEKEQIGTTAVLLPADAGAEACPETTDAGKQLDEQDRLLQTLRELHDLELLAGVET